MTNFVKIHCMKIEQLAELLSKCSVYGEGPWYKWFDEVYCKKCERIAKGCGGDVPCEFETGCPLYDDSDKNIILMWLNAEYKEVDSDEVKREGSRA